MNSSTVSRLTRLSSRTDIGLGGQRRTFSKCPFASIITATAPAVGPKARAIVDDFYPRMFRQNPETKAFFNPANQFAEPPRQRMALANAVVAYATNIEDLTPLLPAVEIIAHKHCGLSVEPQHYTIVHKNLMESIAEVLGADVVTEEIGGAWSDAVLQLAKILYDREEELYKMAEARQGGWRGLKDFKLVNKRAVSEEGDCMEFTFEDASGSREPIDFTTGQFLTLHMKQEGATPRHYTVTNKPGEPFLQCCVKRIEKGFVSNALHELDLDATVGLAAPFGVFSMGEKQSVLISAGIGATPMTGFLASKAEQVALAVHVDRSAATQPFKEEFVASGVSTHFHYTESEGRPTGKDLVDTVLKSHIASDCDFFLCGPTPFLADMKGALESAGATGVHCDVFGPELA